LPNKKYSHNNWHGNTINVFSSKGENTNNNNNNKIVKKYIDHLRSTNKTISSNALKKSNYIDMNKSKMK